MSIHLTRRCSAENTDFNNGLPMQQETRNNTSPLYPQPQPPSNSATSQTSACHLPPTANERNCKQNMVSCASWWCNTHHFQSKGHGFTPHHLHEERGCTPKQERTQAPPETVRACLCAGAIPHGPAKATFYSYYHTPFAKSTLHFLGTASTAVSHFYCTHRAPHCALCLRDAQ